MSNIDAGMSQVTTALLTALLDYIFHHGHCFVQTAGIKLKGNSGGPDRLFFELGALLQDGAAHSVKQSVAFIAQT